jgi:hypothetical protein
MANPEYIFTERFFHKHRETMTGDSMLDGTGIDPMAEVTSAPLTVARIKAVLPALGLEMRDSGAVTGEPENWECFIYYTAPVEENEWADVWLIAGGYTGDEAAFDDTEILELEVGRGSDPRAVIEVFTALAETCGKFLYYSEGGSSAAIAAGKPVEQSFAEFLSDE